VVGEACTRQGRSEDNVEYSEIGDDYELQISVYAHELSCSLTDLDKSSPPSLRPP
jgi:hypothetical protein